MKSFNKYELQAELKKELHNRKENDRYVFYDDYLSIEYIDHFNGLYADWKGHQTEQSVTIGCEKMLEALKIHNCFSVLNDNTNSTGIWTPDPARVGDWWSRMMQSGLKYFAWIRPPGDISQPAVRESITHAELYGVINTFDNIDEARIWLLQNAK